MPSEVPSERSADDRMLVGECECGAVRYQVADAFLYAANCHYSRCRAATGSALRWARLPSRGRLATNTRSSGFKLCDHDPRRRVASLRMTG
jgi:hypothetical protein